MPALDSSFITAITATVGAIVWLVRLEGRINAHDALFSEREKSVNERHEDLNNRLDRIERKIDLGFNGRLRG